MKIIQIKSEFEDIALNLLEENNILYENVTYKYSANKQKSSDYDEKFMIEDFKESYQMLRHYDDVNWSIMKFCFSQVIIIIGAGWTFDIAFKKQVDGMFSLFSSYPYIILGSIFMLSTLFVLFLNSAGCLLA